MNRAERRDALIRAIENEEPRARELTLCAAELQSCFVRWSQDACIRWTIELAIDGYSRGQIEEAARLVARAVRDPSPADLTAEAATLKKNAGMESTVSAMIQPERSLPSMTGDPHVNKLAASTTISDTLSGLVASAEVEDEMSIRRKMTPSEIAARRADLVEQRKELVKGRPLPKFEQGS